MPLRIDAWPHYPTARGTIPSGADPANPAGWGDNLDKILTAMNGHTHTLPKGPTWSIMTDITTGLTIPGFFVSDAMTLKEVYVVLEAGTSVLLKLVRTPFGGAPTDLAAPFNAITASNTAANITGNVALAKGDYLKPVITTATGACSNLVITVVVSGNSGT